MDRKKKFFRRRKSFFLFFLTNNQSKHKTFSPWREGNFSVGKCGTIISRTKARSFENNKFLLHVPTLFVSYFYYSDIFSLRVIIQESFRGNLKHRSDRRWIRNAINSKRLENCERFCYVRFYSKSSRKTYEN